MNLVFLQESKEGKYWNIQISMLKTLTKLNLIPEKYVVRLKSGYKFCHIIAEDLKRW